MTTPEERIKDLARKSAIDPGAADRLLAAVRPDPLTRTHARTWNPFERWSTSRCIGVGIATSLVALSVSRLALRYSGFMDQHVSATPVAWSTALVDQVAVFPVAALVFWAVARGLARHVRFVDMLATVGLSRAPMTLFALPLVLLASRSPGGFRLTGLMAVSAGIGLVGLGLQVTCLVLGFRTATGLRGPRLTVGFLLALVLAEVVTKIISACV